MKYFLLAICCLFFVNDSYSQRKKKKRAKSTKFLTIQGGFLFDGVDKDLDATYDPTNIGPNNYTGFSLFNLSLQRLKEDKLTGISLKSSYFKSDATRELIIGSTVNFPRYASHYGREKLILEARVNHSFSLFGDMNNGLYAGPALSLGGVRDNYTPLTSLTFPLSRNFLFLGAGFQVDYYLKLTKKMFLAIGTQMTLVDLAVGRERNGNPILPQRQQRGFYTNARFLRPHFPFMLGLTFALGK